MKVLLIKPMEHPQVVDIDAKALAKECCRVLECDIITVAFPWEDKTVLVTDDEGFFTHKPFSRYIKELGYPIIGNFLICGSGDEDLEELPEELICKYMECFWKPEIFINRKGKISITRVDDGTKPEYKKNSLG